MMDRDGVAMSGQRPDEVRPDAAGAPGHQRRALSGHGRRLRDAPARLRAEALAVLVRRGAWRRRSYDERTAADCASRVGAGAIGTAKQGEARPTA